MTLQDAIQRIEERGDYNRYTELKPIFEERLKTLKISDYTQRGLCYYYLLVSYLKAHLVHETEESVDFFEHMDKAFRAQEKIYAKHAGQFSDQEISDFYKLMERCYNALEFLYQRHDFQGRRTLAYQRKMHFRKMYFKLAGQWLSWVEYQLLDLTCHYGTSVIRWGMTTITFLVAISLAYMFLDTQLPLDQQMLPKDPHWFDYFYFSIIVLTTVGLGDIVPMSLAAKMLTALEASVGFMMLGVFMGMLQRKL